MAEEGNKISPTEIEDRIVKLIFVAEVNLECCKLISNYLKKENRLEYSIFLNKDENKYLVLSELNHFCESIGIVHTLLHRVDKKNRELSFQLYQDEVLSKECYNNKTEKFITSMKNLWKKFEKGKFPEIRNKICFHKEFENIGDPATLVILPLAQQLIEKLEQVIKDLKGEVFKFFKDSVSNNSLNNSEQGLKSILNSISEEHK